jgi:hypothetical protein
MADADTTTEHRAQVALDALRCAGGRSTVYAMVRGAQLPDDGSIGWGLTFAALERRGLVGSEYQSVESAGSSKIWFLP